MSTVDINCRLGNYGYPRDQRAEGRGCKCGSGASEESTFADKITCVAKNAVEGVAGESNAGRTITEPSVDEGTGTAAGAGTAGATGAAAGAGTAGATGTAAGAGTAAAAGAKSPRDMSLEEYAHYIYGIISELERRNYSRGNSVFIYISEEGFRAMQNDPEYEAWVMQNIRDAYYYAGHRGGHDGYHSAHFFGATKEEYRGQSWSFGCSKCDQERRQELKRRRKKQLQALLKKRHEQKLLEKQRLEKMYLEKRRLEKAAYKKLLVKKETEQERLEEKHRKEALARREAASAFRMYMAILKYNEQ
ncbi:MAG: hypothetical protein K2J60_02630 [Acetatifactor sp.]|nr:hypothetical protein [Acetatifactor sp.]